MALSFMRADYHEPPGGVGFVGLNPRKGAWCSVWFFVRREEWVWGFRRTVELSFGDSTGKFVHSRTRVGLGPLFVVYWNHSYRELS